MAAPEFEQDVEKHSLAEPKRLYEFTKRIFDIVLSFFGIVALSLVFLVVAVLIKSEDGGKIIFSQTRLTRNGKEFKMYKFRSMCPDAEKSLMNFSIKMKSKVLHLS